MPAQQAITPSLVPKHLFQRAIAFILTLFSFKVFVNSIWSKSLLWPFKYKIHVLPIPSNFENEIEESLKSKTQISEIRLVSFLNRCDLNLLKSFLYLKESTFPNIVLFLLGNSTNYYKKYLINNIELLNIKDSVFIYDNIDPYQFSDLLVNSTIYIQLEKVVGDFEGGISTKSGAMMAAMQSGLPIISTVGDMTDMTYFKNLENIFLIKDNRPLSITYAINFILSNKGIFESIGKNARNTYLETNNFYLHSKLLLDILKNYNRNHEL
jgi:glycosyltransferase involved in cell wall biosynthesis